MSAVKDITAKILCEGKSLECGNGDNIFVHGGNLEMLNALLPFYAGEVSCVYMSRMATTSPRMRQTA